jgi:RNA polymerase sigma-70 factor (sigma-E family)
VSTYTAGPLPVIPARSDEDLVAESFPDEVPSDGVPSDGVPSDGVPSDGVLTDEVLAACVAREYERLVRLARLLVDHRTDAEEVVQDALVRVWVARGSVRAVDDPLPYVRRAVVNAARGGLRRRIVERRHRERTVGVRLEDADPRPDVDAVVVDRQRDEHLLDAVRRLPRRQREVIALRYLDELSTAETAGVLGCSEGAVKAYLFRGLARLRDQLEDR